MKFAAGAWIATLGYALVYVATAYFTGNNISLSDALGFSVAPAGDLQKITAKTKGSPSVTEAGTANPSTTTNLNNIPPPASTAGNYLTGSV